MSGGGTDVQYEQSPEQRAVYRALLPMVQRLGQQYGGVSTDMSSFTMGDTPAFQQQPQYGSRLIRGNLPMYTPEGQFAGIQYGLESKLPKQQIYWDPKQKEIIKAKDVYDYPSALPMTQRGSQLLVPQAIGTQPTQPTGGPPTIGGQPAIGGGLYNIPQPPQIPSPAIASPLAAYSMVAPQVQAGLWQPYQEAEKRLLDIMQSRGQLGAPGAGISGAAGGALSDFYSQAARDIGLSTYQMSLPFTQMAQAPLSQYWGAQTGQLGDLWSAQLAREMMPWQMLPGLLGGTYSTGIAQEKTSPLPGFLTTAGLGIGAAFGAPWVGGAIGSAAGSMFV